MKNLTFDQSLRNISLTDERFYQLMFSKKYAGNCISLYPTPFPNKKIKIKEINQKLLKKTEND